MIKMEVIIRHSRFEVVKHALVNHGVHGLTVSEVKGFGKQGGHKEIYRGSEVRVDFNHKIKLEIVLESEKVKEVVDLIREAAVTGEVGDGKIFIYPLTDVIRIRTGESGREAM
ncbi:MAG: P-II family nitrogen regulator [Candidatus Adiutrix sp.]|jgi:nitrogen regulatory protein P-II 1|nr:P-II family nitrogen regulator [Candidatus Adiutrix sp.]